MMRILEHFVPNTEFNLHTLKALAESLTNGTDNSQTSPSSDIAAPVNGSPGLAVPRADVQMNDAMDASVDEIEDLHKELGWLRVDSTGVYRMSTNPIDCSKKLTVLGHVGANSTYLFLDAVRSLKRPRLDASSPKSEVLAPLSAAEPCPPITPETTQSLKTPRQINLPRRDLCDGCIARFFREIQSVYWFFSAEQLHARLDRIYAGDAAAATPATLCALYSIFAMTCETQMHKENPGLDTRPSLRYLALAKALVPALCDTGDIDSLRALCLLVSNYT